MVYLWIVVVSLSLFGYGVRAVLKHRKPASQRYPNYDPNDRLHSNRFSKPTK